MIGDNAWVVIMDLDMDLVTGSSMAIIQTGWMGYSWTVLLIATVGARSCAEHGILLLTALPMAVGQWGGERKC